MPLNPILAQVPFEKWDNDFVGPIKPPSCYGKKYYILVATKYVIKWAEALATKTNDAKIFVKLLYKNIIINFGCSEELVSDQGTHFIDFVIKYLINKYLIKHCKSFLIMQELMINLKKLMGYCIKLLPKLFKALIMIGLKDF